MVTVTSISTVDKVYETMSRPLRVYCSDYNHYICKFGRPYDLLNEMISAQFCLEWGIRVPQSAYVQLRPEHLPTGLNRRQYDHLGYGSEYLEHAQELSEFLLTWRGNTYDIGRIVNREDLLLIGLFDLWIANEDRNHNNANLLIQPTHEGFFLVAIDHVNIFNTNTLEKGLVCLTQESSILYSQYVPLLLGREKLQFAITKLEKEFPKKVAKCKTSLKKTLADVPPEWGINIEVQTKQMEQLFSAEWAKEVIANFKLYIALNFA